MVCLIEIIEKVNSGELKGDWEDFGKSINLQQLCLFERLIKKNTFTHLLFSVPCSDVVGNINKAASKFDAFAAFLKEVNLTISHTILNKSIFLKEKL